MASREELRTTITGGSALTSTAQAVLTACRIFVPVVVVMDLKPELVQMQAGPVSMQLALEPKCATKFPLADETLKALKHSIRALKSLHYL